MSGVSYDKWDKIADSEDEEDSKTTVGRARASQLNEERERRLQVQEQIEEWFRGQMHLLRKEENDPRSRSGFGADHHHHVPGRHDRYDGSRYDGGLESRKQLAPYRNVSKEELKVLAMLIAVSDFQEGETNLTRHPEILDLVRHHRWLEEDPGTLELLCRVHNALMRRSGEQRGHPESSEDFRMRGSLLCGINTLAAPKRAKCEGGLLDLVTKICTPETEAARELRKKWQLKEFAKDALFDSLFPDLRQYSDEEKSEESMWEIYLLLALIVLIIIGIIAFVYFVGPQTAGAKAAKNATQAANTSVGEAAAGKAEL